MAPKKKPSYADIDPESILKYMENAVESMETLKIRNTEMDTVYFPVESIARHAKSKKGRRLTRAGIEDDVENLLDELVKEGRVEKASVMKDMINDANEKRTIQSVLVPVPTQYKFKATVGYRIKKK